MTPHSLPPLNLTLTPDGLRDHRHPAEGAGGLQTRLAERLALLTPGAPIVVMLHGRGFQPGDRRHCPHSLLFGDGHARRGPSGKRFMSWPRRLGLATARPERGLAIGFGWSSRNALWTAAAQADAAAPELARLITRIRRIDPSRPVDILAHSLGARLALGALARLHPGAVGRMILLAGAEFRTRACTALDTSAGRAAEVINVTSRENDLFDWMFETAMSPLTARRALGAGLGDLPNAVDIQIDGAGARAALAELGFRLPEPRHRVCHWSVYLRPGVFRLYRRLLFRRQELDLARLRTALAVPSEPRWMRLRKRTAKLAALPFSPDGPSLPA